MTFEIIDKATGRRLMKHLISKCNAEIVADMYRTVWGYDVEVVEGKE